MTAISLPAVRFLPSYPVLNRQVSASRSGSRIVSTIEYGDPFWTILMTTTGLSASERLLVEAFIDQARGGMQTILYTPKHQCLPQAYWGNPSAAAIATDGELASVSGQTITIDEVTNGLTLSAGDLISLSDGDYHAIFRVEVGGVASGGAVSVTVNLPVPSWLPVGSLVRFKNPRMNMRLEPGSFQMPDTNRPSASFALFQVPK